MTHELILKYMFEWTHTDYINMNVEEQVRDYESERRDYESERHDWDDRNRYGLFPKYKTVIVNKDVPQYTPMVQVLCLNSDQLEDKINELKNEKDFKMTIIK